MAAVSEKRGAIAGTLLVAGLVNGPIGLGLTSLYLLVTARISIHGSQLVLASLLFLKLFWIVGVSLFHGTLQGILPVIGFDLIFLVALLSPVSPGFFRTYSLPVSALLLVDVAFNIWTLLFGADFLGRAADPRPGEDYSRLGGVFFHSFYSLNISLIALLLSSFLGRRTVFALALFNILINGSLRGLLALIVLAPLSVLLLRRWRTTPVAVAGVAVAAAVMTLTVLSGTSAEIQTGNYFRVLAWDNAITNIAANPLFGTHTFEKGELPYVSEQTIVDYGVAESTYLTYALHYGLVPMIAHFLILLIVLHQNLGRLYREGGGIRSLPFTAALFSALAFVDAFYGSVLGSILATTTFALLCLSTRPSAIQSTRAIP